MDRVPEAAGPQSLREAGVNGPLWVASSSPTALPRIVLPSLNSPWDEPRRPGRKYSFIVFTRITATAGEDLRAEVAEVLERVAPDVTSEVRIDDRGVYSEDTNVSKQKRLIVTILEDKRDFMDVAMGNIERGPLGELTLASVIEAVLETHEIPVLLVPI
jgi:nucleotide-binding universal stress UspA family protein